MKKGSKEIIIVGDRVLIVPDMGEERSNVGLYLPKWAVERELVQGGTIVEIGPGIPMPAPGDQEEELWKPSQSQGHFTPLQARIGDYALFMRKGAIELKMDGDSYLIVPQSALLVLIRDRS
ncbi:co-chaperone GroES [candidate division KSB1 bacterium]|nr:co-chaperone GroES [candidate division KSB1 bacterium]